MSTVQRCVRRIKSGCNRKGSTRDIEQRGRTCTAAGHDNIRRTGRRIRLNSRITDTLCSNLSIGKGAIWGRLGGGEIPPFQYLFTCEQFCFGYRVEEGQIKNWGGRGGGKCVYVY